MKIKDVINGIKTDMEAVLPALVEKYGQPPLDDFSVGYPFSQDKLSCCLRFAKLEFLGDFEFIVHLSLPHTEEEAAYDYLQAVCEYLANFETVDYGFYEGTYILELYENDFNHGDIQAFFSVTLKKAVEDCDLGVG
ncbi:MAG: hypothetical protein LBO04_01235 [Spirochaetaceae bacterium]|jgi:hypothetical protein|nr:hypothetical protein [Spirochaetaceae bacterium]